MYMVQTKEPTDIIPLTVILSAACGGSKMFFSELERLLVIKRTSFDYNSLCSNLVDQVNCFQDSLPPFHCTSGRKMCMHLNV